MEAFSCSSCSNMDFHDVNLNSEQNISRIESSSIPATHVKPILPNRHLIQSKQQENHEIMEKTEIFSTGFCQESCFEVKRDVNSWKKALAGKSQVFGGKPGVDGKVCFDAKRKWNNKPWRHKHRPKVITKTPPSEVAREVSNRKTFERNSKSARRALNFESDEQKRNERSVSKSSAHGDSKSRKEADDMEISQVTANEKQGGSEKTKFEFDENVASFLSNLRYQTRQATAKLKDFEKKVCRKPTSPIVYQRRAKKAETVVPVLGHNDNLLINDSSDGPTRVIDLVSEIKFRPFFPRKQALLNGEAEQGDETSHKARTVELLVDVVTKRSRKDETIVPFNGSLVPKRRPRPKVNLDDETTRVWKLLLENQSSKGIDGSNEKNAKSWEEERNIFRARADSFIAHMHLVQGDRRFSQWKGSVLDSVVGVFLTQNVSDHLSSSAYMSLAAHFPLKPTSNSQQVYDDDTTNILVEEPELCEVDVEDSVDLRETLLQNLVGDPSYAWACGVEHKVDKEVADSSESFSSGTSQESTIQNSGPITSCTMEEKSVMEDVILFQSLVETLMDETAERRPKKCAKSNSEGQNSAMGRESTSFKGQSSLLELLKISTDPEFDKHDRCENSMKEFDQSLGDAYIPLDPTHNISGEIFDVTESISTLYDKKKMEVNGVDPNLKQHNPSKNRKRVENEKNKDVDWDSLRKQAQANVVGEITADTSDSVDWEAVRCANVDEIACSIRVRGMNNRLAERIKIFLNRLKREHGSLDLEWLRYVPPDKAKEFLLSFSGLGLKSAECVRLLTLHQLAFPVDTNVGRIAVRLGWVPLQTLPESLQLHLLELYPVLESIQKYLWPRLCKLDQRTLYELHYQMITFGKVFCTKTKPNCNSCPMRGDCRHFASAFASARLALPGPEEKSSVSTREQHKTADQNPTGIIIHKVPLPSLQVDQLEANQPLETQTKTTNNEPIIEEPVTPEPPECAQILECDIEDVCLEDPYIIPTIKLDIEEFTQNLQAYMQKHMKLQEGDMTRALVALTPEAASIPTPRLKYINRLRTEHQVYELPDSHPLVQGLEKREPGDPCFYLLAIWTPGTHTTPTRNTSYS